MPRRPLHPLATAATAAAAALAAAACSGESVAPPATPDPTASPQPSARPVPPRVRLDAPLRASFHGAGAQVAAAGFATAGSAPLASLLVDEADSPLGPDGAFREVLAARPGVNVLDVKVEDARGGRATEALGYFYGAVRAPGETLPGAMSMHLGPQFLDDDAPDVDDLARIVEVMVMDPSFRTAFQEPFETDYVIITPRTVDFSGAQVDLVPFDGELDVTVVLTGLVVTFAAEGVDILGWVESDGVMRADRARVQMALSGSVGPGGVDVDVVRNRAELEGFHVDLDLVPDFAEDYEFVQDELRALVIESVQEEAGPLVEETLAEVLGAFAVERTLGEANPITLGLRLERLDVLATGLYLGLSAFLRPSTQNPSVPPEAGSLRTEPEPPAIFDNPEPVGLALDDDFLNQVFYAFWESGLLGNLVLGPERLAELGAERFPEPIAPLRELALEVHLPPTLTATGEAGFHYDLGLGEAVVRLTRQDGEVFELSVSLRAGVELTVGEGGAVGLRLDDRPRAIELGVSVLRAPEFLDPADVAALGRLILPPVLGRAGTGFGALPLPDFDLYELLEVEALRGVALRMDVRDVAILEPERHALAVRGALVPP